MLTLFAEFHMVADWLNDYMLNQRKIQNSPSNLPQRQKTVVNDNRGQFFQRLFNKTKEITETITVKKQKTITMIL